MVSIDGVEMVDVREAAELVQRTPETVRRWVWTHRVEAVKHGNKLLLRRDELLRLVRGGEGAAQARTLAEWSELVRTAGQGGAPGGTSRDLVLADRDAREGAAGAGR